jgi:hypothetical protein
LSLLQALLDFVELNLTYILPVPLRNVKPNNSFVPAIRTDIKAHATDPKGRGLFQLAQIVIAFVGIISNFPWILFPKRLTGEGLHRTNINAFVTISTAVFQRFFGGIQSCIRQDAAPSHPGTHAGRHQKAAFTDPAKSCKACRAEIQGERIWKQKIRGMKAFSSRRYRIISLQSDPI